ncbi:cytochrome p450 86b1-like protein [Trifolium pratense]|uniref:Cytochrome p450 86b1-like protein n=1 Tax=Trifolium pratense TaxID=57577 RepID=A0A2K3JJY1_TRIPR|nr:cytochrome p450 86b1-like protein [Trifolium pratense]
MNGSTKGHYFIQNKLQNCLLPFLDQATKGVQALYSKSHSCLLKDLMKEGSEKGENFTSVEVLDKLVYLHGAISEALRLFPPLAFQHKCAIKSDKLPSGDHVKPNINLIYSLYAMGSTEKIWGEDCLEFKPKKWISDRGQIKHVPSYKFIAFDAGPRSCLGKDISFVEMKMVAISILWKFRIHVVEGHSIVPKVSIALRMEHGLKIKVNKRYD